MLYQLHELRHAMLTPARLTAELTRMTYRNPWNLTSYTGVGRTISANAEMFERLSTRFDRPVFGIEETVINGERIKVERRIASEKPFCNLLHFKRQTDRHDPRVLLVAPMSGHFSTLLRGTVEALVPHHEVFITDWVNAKLVPLKDGSFNLDDYIAYIRYFLSLLGPDTHVIAVCQPSVPVAAAISLMEADDDPNTPLSMTLMGGPVDTRISKTEVTKLAESRPLDWFEHSVITNVPFYYPGAHRRVYPGFIQLSGFMSMNLDRHVSSHVNFYRHLISGDGDSAELHRKFYNEYMSVMDIPAEFYLQTVRTVFQEHLLPRGKMVWHDPVINADYKVDMSAIRHTAVLTVEGELDDISAHGQTTAIHDLCSNLAPDKKYHHCQMAVGHYGIFNGRRWREHIMPRIRHFIRQFDQGSDSVPEADLKLIPDKRPAQWDKSKHGVEAMAEKLHKQELNEAA